MKQEVQLARIANENASELHNAKSEALMSRLWDLLADAEARAERAESMLSSAIAALDHRASTDGCEGGVIGAVLVQELERLESWSAVHGQDSTRRRRQLHKAREDVQRLTQLTAAHDTVGAEAAKLRGEVSKRLGMLAKEQCRDSGSGQGRPVQHQPSAEEPLTSNAMRCEAIPKKKQGRPLGSKNKPKCESDRPARRPRGRPRKTDS